MMVRNYIKMSIDCVFRTLRTLLSRMFSVRHNRFDNNRRIQDQIMRDLSAAKVRLHSGTVTSTRYGRIIPPITDKDEVISAIQVEIDRVNSYRFETLQAHYVRHLPFLREENGLHRDDLMGHVTYVARAFHVVWKKMIDRVGEVGPICIGNDDTTFGLPTWVFGRFFGSFEQTPRNYANIYRRFMLVAFLHDIGKIVDNPSKRLINGFYRYNEVKDHEEMGYQYMTGKYFLVDGVHVSVDSFLDGFGMDDMDLAYVLLHTRLHGEMGKLSGKSTRNENQETFNRIWNLMLETMNSACMPERWRNHLREMNEEERSHFNGVIFWELMFFNALDIAGASFVPSTEDMPEVLKRGYDAPKSGGTNQMHVALWLSYPELYEFLDTLVF